MKKIPISGGKRPIVSEKNIKYIDNHEEFEGWLCCHSTCPDLDRYSENIRTELPVSTPGRLPVSGPIPFFPRLLEDETELGTVQYKLSSQFTT
jgi:hypothetical protein